MTATTNRIAKPTFLARTLEAALADQNKPQIYRSSVTDTGEQRGPSLRIPRGDGTYEARLLGKYRTGVVQCENGVLFLMYYDQKKDFKWAKTGDKLLRVTYLPNGNTARHNFLVVFEKPKETLVDHYHYYTWWHDRSGKKEDVRSVRMVDGYALVQVQNVENTDPKNPPLWVMYNGAYWKLYDELGDDLHDPELGLFKSRMNNDATKFEVEGGQVVYEITRRDGSRYVLSATRLAAIVANAAVADSPDQLEASQELAQAATAFGDTLEKALHTEDSEIEAGRGALVQV